MADTTTVSTGRVRARRPRRRASRWRTLWALLLAAALVAASCGDSEDDDAEGTDAETAESSGSADDEGTAGEEPGDEGSSADAPASDVQLTHWNYHASQGEQQGLRDAAAAFGEASGIEVTSEAIPLGDYNTRIVTAVQAGGLPDTGHILVGTLPDVVALGGLVDLTDRVEAWDGRDAFPENVWQDCMVDGKVYGIPAFVFVPWLYYRADWLEEAGVEPPTTWDEFRDVAIAINDPDQDRYGHSMRGGVGGGNFLADIIESYGTGLVVDGEVVVDRDVLTEALSFYSGLFTDDGVVPPTAPEDSFQQLLTQFTTGQSGLFLHTTNSFRDVSAALEPVAEFGTVPYPSGDGGSAGRFAVQCNGMYSDEHADEAWEWLTYWATDEPQLIMFESAGLFPATLSTREDPSIADDPIYSQAVASMETAQPSSSFSGKGAWSSEVLLPAFQGVLVGQLDVATAVDDIVAGLEETVE
jgi:multiple sugar transport system substrate-binding protein